MANKKDTKETKEVTPVDIDALVEKRLSVNKEELRQQIIEEQLSGLLKSDAVKEASLNEFIEQLKAAGKEIWKSASQRSVLSLAREISGANRLEEKLKSRRARRASAPAGEIEELKKRLVDYLKGANEKQTIGQIAKGLQSDPTALKRPIAELRKANQITSEGEKRSMRYSIVAA